MNFHFIFFAIPIEIIYLAGFFLLVFFLGRNATKIKGKLGEKYISRCLRNLDADKYILLSDLLLETENGNTSQIDQLVISVYGIFVIETKNYKGWIFGNEKSDIWTQVIYERKNQFRNPVKQNWSHIYALKAILTDYSDLRYIPVIVFTGSAVLKNIVSNVPVIYDYEIRNFITEYPVDTCISIEDVRRISSILQSKNIEDKEIRKEHIQKIYRTVTERQLKMEKLICPRCNGNLRIRNGKSGIFYGCSNYPRCKFTMPY